MAKMSYQEANYIKGAGLGNLIEQNMRSGKGLIGATRGAIGQRMSANATGIKEKLDPLNLFKFLSGGNPLAFRLLGGRAFGRLTGRNNRDVDYFAGGPGTKKRKKTKAEPFVVHKVSKQITPIQKEDTMADGLSKLYSLIKSSFEEKIKKSELQKDFEEARQTKAQKRHDELLKAIYSINGRKPPTASKADAEGNDVSLFDKLKNQFEDLKNDLSDLKNAWNSIKWLGSTAGTALETFAGYLGALPGGVASLFLLPWMLSSVEREKIKANPNAPEYKDNPYAMFLRGEAKSEGAAAKTNTAKAVKQIPRQEITQSVASDLSDDELKSAYGADRPTLTKWLKDNPSASFYQAPTKTVPTKDKPTAVPAAAPASPTMTPSNTGGGDSSSATPSATPAPSISPTGAKAVEATNTNMVAQNESLSSGEQIVVNNQTKNTAAGGKAQSSSIGETAVRNDDDSLMKVQKQSLRGV